VGRSNVQISDGEAITEGTPMKVEYSAEQGYRSVTVMMQI